MIYLKPYKIFESNKLYSDISYNDYCMDIADKKADIFTESEIEYLTELGVICFSNNTHIRIRYGVDSMYVDYKTVIDFDKSSDEWYYIVINSTGRIGTKCFKCDTFDGIKQVINDYKNDIPKDILNESNSNKLYVKITSDQFNNSVYVNFMGDHTEYSKDITNLSEDEIESLNNFGDLEDNYHYMKIETNHKVFYLFKTLDEWFYIRFSVFNCYKCDTFEGVKQFLSDITKYSKNKMFESIDTKLYEKLPIDLHHNIKNYLYDNIINMNVVDFNLVKNYIKRHSIKFIDLKKEMFNNEFSIMSFFDPGAKKSYAIYALTDDYFLVFIFGEITLRVYRCDTIQGVIQFFHNINNLEVWDNDSAMQLHNNWLSFDYNIYESIENNKLYKFVDTCDPSSFLIMSKKNKDFIMNYLKDKDPKYLGGEYGSKSYSYITYNINHDIYYDFYELEDDYFMVVYINTIADSYDDNGSRRYYICDGLDGIKQIINDYKNDIPKNILNESNSNKLYTQESNIQELLEDEDTDEPFTQDELTYLSGIGEFRFTNPGYGDLRVIIDSVTKRIKSFIIARKRDEYYYIVVDIMNSIEYFKCDTFEGVKQLIQDVLNKKLILNESNVEQSDKLYTLMDPQDLENITHYYNDYDSFGIGKLKYSDRLLELNNDDLNYLRSVGVISVVGSSYTKFKGIDLSLFIFRMPDEWYYIIDNHNLKCYKCDTFQGVKQVIAIHIKSNESKLYDEQDNIEFNRIVDDPYTDHPFSNREIEYLRTLGRVEILEPGYIIFFVDNIPDEYYGDNRVTIYKKPDEYYYVIFYHQKQNREKKLQKYRCDSFDGVKEVIQDIKRGELI